MMMKKLLCLAVLSALSSGVYANASDRGCEASDGKAKGCSEQFEKGYHKGYQEGYDDGYAQGQEDFVPQEVIREVPVPFPVPGPTVYVDVPGPERIVEVETIVEKEVPGPIQYVEVPVHVHHHHYEEIQVEVPIWLAVHDCTPVVTDNGHIYFPNVNGNKGVLVPVGYNQDGDPMFYVKGIGAAPDLDWRCELEWTPGHVVTEVYWKGSTWNVDAQREGDFWVVKELTRQ